MAVIIERIARPKTAALLGATPLAARAYGSYYTVGGARAPAPRPAPNYISARSCPPQGRPWHPLHHVREKDDGVRAFVYGTGGAS